MNVIPTESLISSVVMIGAGNVATHLGQQLYKQGISVAQVFSRNLDKATRLAQQIEAEPINDLRRVQLGADIYLIAVHDSAIAEVAAQLPKQPLFVVHTSGATPATVFAAHYQRYGVFYPLQTFSANQPVDFHQIPICIYATDESDLALLQTLAQRLSQQVHTIDDHQRAILHVAAVFVNNFTNYLFHIGYDILQQEELPFDLLRPLIQETAQKVQQQAPVAMQTGPAIRHDDLTIVRHMDYLQRFPTYQMLYKIITKSIQNQ